MSELEQDRSRLESDIELWLDQGVLMIRAVDSHGDPIELAEHEVDNLIEALRRLREQMDE